MKGFRCGGVDYISKPFQLDEAYARVETHLKLHDLQRALLTQNELLEEIVAARTRELSAAHGRLTMLDRAKDDFLKIISHEMRTPLNGMIGVSQIVLNELAPSPENAELLQMFEQSRRRLIGLLDDALLLTQIEVDGDEFAADAFSLFFVVNSAVERSKGFAATRDVQLKLEPGDYAQVNGQIYLLVRALQALVETAIKFSEASGAVVIRPGRQGAAEVVLETQGGAILTGAIPRFFDVFSVSEALTPGGDIGLAPPLARRILNLFGGSRGCGKPGPAGDPSHGFLLAARIRPAWQELFQLRPIFTEFQQILFVQERVRCGML